MIERVYGHFRNQSYQEAQARLDRERATRGAMTSAVSSERTLPGLRVGWLTEAKEVVRSQPHPPSDRIILGYG
jgi:hypothetical protein